MNRSKVVHKTIYRELQLNLKRNWSAYLANIVLYLSNVNQRATSFDGLELDHGCAFQSNGYKKIEIF